MLKIFIPVYNEEKIIYRNLMKIYVTFIDLFFHNDFFIYIINDGSIDSTEHIVEILRLDLRVKNIIQIKYDNPTVRENLVQSMAEYSNSNDLVLFMDVDLSTDMSVIPQLLEEIENGYDIIIGSRYIKGSRLKRNLFRFIISKLFNLFIRIYFGSKIKDHECGFKLFKAKVIKDLVEEMGWNLQRRAFWDSEMLVRAQKKGYSIKEIPIIWTEGYKSYISLNKEKSMILYALKLRFRM